MHTTTPSHPTHPRPPSPPPPPSICRWNPSFTDANLVETLIEDFFQQHTRYSSKEQDEHTRMQIDDEQAHM